MYIAGIENRIIIFLTNDNDQRLLFQPFVNLRILHDVIFPATPVWEVLGGIQGEVMGHTLMKSDFPMGYIAAKSDIGSSLRGTR